LDQATYFTAAAVKDFVVDESIELVYFSTGSPDLNPTEEYWRRLKSPYETATSAVAPKSDQQSGQYSNRLVHPVSINTSVFEYATFTATVHRFRVSAEISAGNYRL
jgi:hypothetical protein